MPFQSITFGPFKRGYNSSTHPESVGVDQFDRGSLDVRLDRNGAAEKRQGYSKALTDEDGNWTAYNEALGLAEFVDSNARWLVRVGRDSDAGSNSIRAQWIDVALGSAVEADVNGPVTLGHSGTEKQYAQMAMHGGLGKLFVACPALSALQYLSYSGGNLIKTDVTTSGTARTLNKPRGCELWYDRIWFYCDSSIENGSYVLFTDTDGAAVDLDYNFQSIPDGGAITGIARVRERLLVFKRQSIYILSGGDDPLNALRIDQLSSDVGCSAPRSIVKVEDGVYFLSDRGFYYTNGSTLQFIGKPVEREVSEISETYYDQIVGVHHRAGRKVAWFVPASGESSGGAWGDSAWGETEWGAGGAEGKALCFDYFHGAWTAPYTNQPFDVACTFTNTISPTSQAEEIVVVNEREGYSALDASNAGLLYVWEDGNLDDATMVNAKLVTPPFLMGDTGLVKVFRKAYLQHAALGSEGGYVPFRIRGYDLFRPPTTGDTPDFTSTQQIAGGADTAPVYGSTRHTIGLISRTPRLEVGDYDDGTEDGGRWSLSSIQVLFAVKGRRT